MKKGNLKPSFQHALPNQVCKLTLVYLYVQVISIIDEESNIDIAAVNSVILAVLCFGK